MTREWMSRRDRTFRFFYVCFRLLSENASFFERLWAYTDSNQIDFFVRFRAIYILSLASKNVPPFRNIAENLSLLSRGNASKLQCSYPVKSYAKNRYIFQFFSVFLSFLFFRSFIKIAWGWSVCGISGKKRKMNANDIQSIKGKLLYTYIHTYIHTYIINSNLYSVAWLHTINVVSQ